MPVMDSTRSIVCGAFIILFLPWLMGVNHFFNKKFYYK